VNGTEEVEACVVEGPSLRDARERQLRPRRCHARLHGFSAAFEAVSPDGLLDRSAALSEPVAHANVGESGVCPRMSVVSVVVDDDVGGFRGFSRQVDRRKSRWPQLHVPETAFDVQQSLVLEDSQVPTIDVGGLMSELSLADDDHLGDVQVTNAGSARFALEQTVFEPEPEGSVVASLAESLASASEHDGGSTQDVVRDADVFRPSEVSFSDDRW